MNKKCFFITGIDTNVGKTTLCLNLINKSYLKGYLNILYKPILLKSKKKILFNNINNIYRFYFNSYSSPNILNIKDKNFVLFKKINLNILLKKNNFLIIEGIGGIFILFSKNQLYLNWIIKEKIPLLIVICIKIGCINHSLLTFNFLNLNNILFSGWYINLIDFKYKYTIDYLKILYKILPPPFLGEIKHKNYFLNYLNNFLIPK